MIYTVECSYTDLASEAEWNDFYSLDKLPALISVAGFHTSQRFRALSGGCPRYLALHSIDGLNVLLGQEYRQKGGGDFSRWQPHISDWRRNLYEGLDRVPAVSYDECLVLSSTGPEPLTRMNLPSSEMQAVALERSPKYRWLGTLSAPAGVTVEDWPEEVYLYAPMTIQLTPGRDTAGLR